MNYLSLDSVTVVSTTSYYLCYLPISVFGSNHSIGKCSAFMKKYERLYVRA